MAAQDGFSGRILICATFAGTFKELNCTEDLTISGPSTPMIKSKGRKSRDVAMYFHGSQTDCVLNVGVVIDPEDDAYAIVKTALSAKSKVTLVLADRVPESGDKVDKGEFLVFTPERQHTGGEEGILNVTFAPAYGDPEDVNFHPLEEITWS